MVMVSLDSLEGFNNLNETELAFMYLSTVFSIALVPVIGITFTLINVRVALGLGITLGPVVCDRVLHRRAARLPTSWSRVSQFSNTSDNHHSGE